MVRSREAANPTPPLARAQNQIDAFRQNKASFVLIGSERTERHRLVRDAIASTLHVLEQSRDRMFELAMVNGVCLQMSVRSIVGISGSSRRLSRTTVVVKAVLEAIEAATASETELIELVDAAPHLFATLTRDVLHENQRGSAIVRTIESADIIVVGTPVYRASYSGALKHVFDLVHHEALAGKIVVLAATGGSLLHGLVTEHQLRPLFGFFRALTIPTTIYATEQDFADSKIVNPDIHARVTQAACEAVGLLPPKSTAASVPGVARSVVTA
jgi:FMN reductase